MMRLTALRYALKIFHPLVLLAGGCFVAAYLISTYPEHLRYRRLAPFEDVDRNFWIVLLLIVLGLLFTFMILVRIYFWFTLQVIPALLDKQKRDRQKKDMRARTVADPDRGTQELDALDAMMDAVFAILKKRGRLAGGNDYALPWYFVTGPVQAGKSALIAGGDLHFPLDHDIAAACAPYSDMLCHSLLSWHVAGNEAVLLELNGAWLDPNQEERELRSLIWSRFLENLRLHRPRQPVTGLVVVLDIGEFAAQTQADRDALAQALRRQISEAAQVFDTEMTLHLTLTQLDRLNGFAELFDSLSPEARGELAALPISEAGSRTHSWDTELETSYIALAERLSLFLRDSLMEISTAYARQEAITFVQSIAGMRAPLMAFCRAAFGADKFTKTPLFRGIALSSAQQENDMHNVMLSEVAQHYGLTQPVYPVRKARSMPFFLDRYWKQFVFSQAGLASENARERQTHRRGLVALSAVTALACAVIVGLWSQRYNAQVAIAEKVMLDARRFSGLAQTGAVDPTGKAYLEALNVIGASTRDLGAYWQRSSLVSYFTLDKSQRIGPLSDQLYRRELNKVFVPNLMRGIESTLRYPCLRGSNTQLQALNVYRMLGELDARQQDVVKKYFRNFWQNTFPGQAAVQSALAGHLDYALNGARVAYDVDPEVIAEAQTDLRNLSPHTRVFLEMRSLADRQLPNPLTFTAQIGTGFDRAYIAERPGDLVADRPANAETCATNPEGAQTHDDPFQITRFFTRAGYHEFFLEQLDDVADVAAHNLWTLGMFETTEYSEEDYASIRDRLRQTYVEEYIRIWRQALNSARIRRFASLRDAVEVTGDLSALDSPMRRLAELTQDQTTIYTPRSVELQKSDLAEAALSFDPDREAGLRINYAFHDIHEMLDLEAETTRPNIDEILAAIAALHDYLKSIYDAPSPSARALELAKMRAQLIGDDPIFTLRQIARRTPPPFDTHLETLADEAWHVILSEVAVEIDRLWREEVYAHYIERLAGRYPIDRTAQVDASLQDFEMFFAPEGILRRFYDEELAIFVDQNSGTPRSIDGQTLPVVPAFARNLDKALEVAPTFFGPDGQLRVEYIVSPLGMNNSLSRAVLNFEGHLVINAHRASRGVQIVWPNLRGAPEMSRFDLSAVSARQQSYGQSFDGPWSWLKLYDQAQKAGISGNYVDVILLDPEGRDAHFRFSAAGSVNPFFNSPFDDFDLPRRVIISPREVLQ